MKRKLDQRQDSSEALAVEVLGWLAGEEDSLLAFLQASGLSPSAIREAASDPGFLGAVLDHVMADETRLLACARALDVKPERIAAAWQRLQPPEFDPEA